MSDQLISVIVPALNAGRYIRRCVDSILAQTHARLEVIVVNDGSTDDTGEQLDVIAAGDPRLKPLHLAANVGIHAARTAGLRVAHGAFIGFVDADDWIEPDMFSDLLAHALACDADIAMCGATIVYSDNQTGPAKVRFRRRRVIEGDLLARFCRLEFGSGVLWNKLYRAAIIRPAANIALERHVGEDYVVNIGCFAAASRVVTVPSSHYRYYCRRDSASRGGTSARLFSELLRAYVACLETYAPSIPRQLHHIDALYAAQMRLACYTVSPLAELRTREPELRESLQRLANVHPAGLYPLIHAFDTRAAARERTFKTAARDFIASSVALFGALQRSLSRTALPLRSDLSRS